VNLHGNLSRQLAAQILDVNAGPAINMWREFSGEETYSQSHPLFCTRTGSNLQ
jgi:hypothetical protein